MYVIVRSGFGNGAEHGEEQDIEITVADVFPRSSAQMR